MDLDIGDKVSYTRWTRLPVPAKVVGRFDEGYVELEYHQDGCRSLTIVAPWMPSFLVSLVGAHPHHPPQVHRSITSPVTRVVAALSVAAANIITTPITQPCPVARCLFNAPQAPFGR